MRNFEDDLKLSDLLSQARLKQLLDLISALSGHSVHLEERPVPKAEPVEFNLECLGWLHSPENADIQRNAARLVEFVIFYIAKYRLAANLHRSVTEANFVELQRQHKALQASEARYKELSEELQARVDAQVKVIEQAQQELYETARLRAVGQLAAGVAHEINNPVGFITSNLRVASDYLDELGAEVPSSPATDSMLEDFRALLLESESGTSRIAAIVSDLKTFSNIDQAEFTPCDLNSLLKTTCHLLQAAHNQVLPVTMELGELAELAGYPAKLSQAFYNILDNAVRSLNERGEIKITTRQNVNNHQEVLIEDTGCGIPDETQTRVFEPFFTTRPVGSGSGLGLTVARDVVAAHNGEIELQSQEGRGTRVILRFWSR
ncbi:two-component sensor histidine kinase [Pseudomonas sp. LTJR-52]|uniref:sensor histidine kinase n=1 Tax=Pseudomonas sp. LTJR-52 TaxID=2479392 RepID=UPI000EFA4EF7|nr:ATP-binding protein [Pseudomonas sp. LTJR-52]AYN96441.1 two-component sensor histidine kinase [Pseudomonas sp. LTJR-52]